MFNFDGKVVNGRIVENQAMVSLDSMCYVLGGNLKPITYAEWTTETAVDLASLILETNPLWYDLVRYYQTKLEKSIDIDNGVVIRALLVDYLLRTSICYVEVLGDNVQYSKNGRYTHRSVSSKFLSSKNADIVAGIEGVLPFMCSRKYSDNFDLYEDYLPLGEIPYIRFNLAQAKKVIKCNKFLNTKNCRIVSIPLLSRWLQGVFKVMEKHYVEFTYLKDDDTERKLVSTVNFDLINKYYSHERTVRMLEDSINGTDIGNPLYLPFKGSVERGWFRLPEIGSSIIDDCGTRAVNFARIKEVKVVDKVDTSYINVSLNSTVEVFSKKVDEYSVTGNNGAIARIYLGLQKAGYNKDLKYPVQSYGNIQEVVGALRSFISDKQYAGTPFKRSLHSFMVANPELFPNYIGQKIEPIQVGNNYGVSTMDF